jgi:RNA polymerase sigma-54 factor
MALGPRLEVRQAAALVMTPQLRQAIQLLQYSNLELAAFVAEELERNPLLERAEPPEMEPERASPHELRGEEVPNAVDPATLAYEPQLPSEAGARLELPAAENEDWERDDVSPRFGLGGRTDFTEDQRGPEEFLESPRSLYEHLEEQLRLEFSDPKDRMIGAHLIALLDAAGRLTTSSETIAGTLGTEVDRVEAVRLRMQRFDPVGLFCRDLRECLAVQLAERNRLDPAMAALLDNLELLAKHEHRQLMAVCGVDADDLREMIAELRTLDPKPGAGFEPSPLALRQADILMRPAANGGFELELNPETLPRVLVNHAFLAKLAPRANQEVRLFLNERLATANWLVRSLEQRAQTILKVAAEIVARQEAFFRLGIGQLRPLTLREVASAVGVHESTVSRVTANKTMATPRGIFELKYFFTPAIAGLGGQIHSAEAVRQRIRALVEAERPDAILSDDAIVAALRKEGVDIARRTVAKYREAMGIQSSAQRRRLKALLD